MNAVVTLLALLTEAMIGYPDWLMRHIGHPVMWIGRLIDGLDHALNDEEQSEERRRLAGFVAVAALVCLPGAIAFLLERELLRLPLGFVAVALLASTLLAQRSLHEHVARVADALDAGGLPAARQA